MLTFSTDTLFHIGMGFGHTQGWRIYSGQSSRCIQWSLCPSRTDSARGTTTVSCTHAPTLHNGQVSVPFCLFFWFRTFHWPFFAKWNFEQCEARQRGVSHRSSRYCWHRWNGRLTTLDSSRSTEVFSPIQLGLWYVTSMLFFLQLANSHHSLLILTLMSELVNMARAVFPSRISCYTRFYPMLIYHYSNIIRIVWRKSRYTWATEQPILCLNSSTKCLNTLTVGPSFLKRSILLSGLIISK